MAAKKKAAKRSTRKVSSRRKSTRRRSLSGSPAEHGKRAERSVRVAVQSYREAVEKAGSRKCSAALDWLLEGGMAEGKLVDNAGWANADSTAQEESAMKARFKALRAFKHACGIKK